MDRATQRKARAWFALTALVVVVGITVQVAVAAGAKPPVRFDSAVVRALNVFVFFTIQSNLIVGGTSLLLALDPERSSTVFNMFRLIGVVAIAITGIVFHAVIAQTLDLESWPLVADRLLHLVVPVMGVLGWLMFGPRGPDVPPGDVALAAVPRPMAGLHPDPGGDHRLVPVPLHRRRPPGVRQHGGQLRVGLPVDPGRRRRGNGAGSASYRARRPLNRVCIDR